MNKERVLQAIDNVKGSPETMDYGRWGALNVEQRRFIKELCNSWLILDDATNKQQEEIERLKKELEIEQDISEGMLETIDKAIEYINQFVDYLPEKDKAFNLLEILKKEENNEIKSS